MPGAGQVELVGEHAAAGGGLGLGELQRRHPEQPVGVHQLVELVGAGRRVGVAVAAGTVGSGREDLQRGRGLLLADLAQQPLDGREQPLLVAGVAREQVEVAAGAAGQRLPGRGGQQLTVDDRREGDPAVGGQAPPVGPLAPSSR